MGDGAAGRGGSGDGGSGDGFSGELWQGISGIYGAILEHPFLTGLTDGSLAPSAFAYYVVQDVLFLQQYARALAAVASRAPDSAGTLMFAEHAAGIISDEQKLHQSLLADLGIDPATADAAEPAPTTLAYTSYLVAVTTTGSYAEGVAAVLPCYQVYFEAGRELARRGSPVARYQHWIDTYASEDFGEVVRAVRDVADELGPGLTPAERALMHRHFRATSRFEWMFWDMGFREETWPV
jgi:thiaminase/transcriptional activator TenA